MTEEKLIERLGRGRAPKLPLVVWKDRLRRLRALIDKKGLDALLVYSGGMELTGQEWARYLANYQHTLWNSEVFVLIPLKGEPTLFLNYKFMVDMAKEISPIKDIRAYKYFGLPIYSVEKYSGFGSLLKSVLEEKGLEKGKVGIGRQGMQGDFFPALLDRAIGKFSPGATFKNASDLLFELIRVKTDYDIKMIRKTAQKGSRALQAALEASGTGARETDLFGAFLDVAGKEGCELTGCYTDWHFFIKSAPGSEYPNVPFWCTGRKLKKGDMIVMDTGVMYQGYRNDMAQTAVVGKPSEKQRKIYETNLNAQKAMEAALRPGVKASELSKINYEVARKAGYERIHDLQGHGIGILENEPPILLPFEETVIDKNMTLTLECWLGVVNVGHSYIEDTFLVTDDKPERLTTLDRELYIAK